MELKTGVATEPHVGALERRLETCDDISSHTCGNCTIQATTLVAPYGEVLAQKASLHS